MKKKNIAIIIGLVLLLVFAGLHFFTVSKDVVDAPLSQRNQESPDEPEIFVHETDVDSADDCSSYEKFNPENSTCYFECDNEELCAKTEDAINAELDSWADEYEGSSAGKEDESRTDDSVVAQYVVKKGENITIKSGKDLPEYQKLWKEVSDLSPDNLTNTYIDSFQIVNDPKSDSLAYVEDEDGNGKWSITINMGGRNELSLQEQKVTIIHELGHIITLNTSQVSPSTKCEVELSEGCAHLDSYAYKFIKEFWSGKKLPYNESNYVTEYAASENVEDLAESWALFVIDSIKTNPVTVADKKVAFFNQFPELLKIRMDMRSVLSRDIIHKRKAQVTQ